MKKAVLRLHCSCGWQELIDVDGSLPVEEVWKEHSKIQEDHMKTHNPNFSLDDFRLKHIGSSKRLIN